VENGRAAEALKVIAAVLADRTRVLGPYHPDTFAARQGLANTYLMTNYPETVRFHEQLAADAGQHLGADDVRTLMARFSLGIALTYAGRPDEGIRELEAAESAA